MKYFLIGFSIYFAIAWMPQLIMAWIIDIRFWWKGKHDKSDDDWTYKI